MRGIQKGLYIEQNNNRSVFLMRDGQFIQGRPAAPLSIGEEGSFYPLTARPKWQWRPIFAPAIAVVAILLLFFSALLPSEDAFAYVQLEMDSSIEFGVDKAIRVISIRELDADGQKLIVKLGDWEGEALDKLIERSIAISVTEETEKVTITTAAKKSADTAKIKFEKMVLTASAAAAKRDIEVRVKKATFVQWEKSVKEKIPVGQKVETYTSVESEEKSKTDQDNEIDMDNDNDKKALKTEKNQSRVKSKMTGEKMEVKPEPAAKTDKGKASIEKKKPLEKNGEPSAAGKTDKFVPPEKAEKAKPAGNTPKPKAIEKKPGVTPAPSENVKPAATGKPLSVTADSNSEKATAEKQESKGLEKPKPQAMPNPKPQEKNEAQDKPKEKIEAQSKPKDKTEVQDKTQEKPEAQSKPQEKKVYAKPEKPGKAEARDSKNQQRKLPEQTPNSKQTGEK